MSDEYHDAGRMADYRQGDIAEVDGRLAVFMPHRWEWMDGHWTAIPLKVGPVLFNVYDQAKLRGDRHARNDEVNRLALILMSAWELAEGRPVNASYIATFADMARAIIDSDTYSQKDANDDSTL